MNLRFALRSAVLGVGLAMDAFSVSLANGLVEPSMPKRRVCLFAGIYAAFQFLMPIVGWFLVRTAAENFQSFQPLIPWIALLLLAWIGGKMLADGIRGLTVDEPAATGRIGLGTLLVQGVATSIDALSVGFTIASYDAASALCASLIIAVTTFLICVAGLILGKRFGLRYARHASILGGLILIAIGLEICIRNLI